VGSGPSNDNGIEGCPVVLIILAYVAFVIMKVVAPGDAFIRVRKQEPVYTHAAFTKVRNYRKAREDRQAIVSGQKLLQHLVVVCASSFPLIRSFWYVILPRQPVCIVDCMSEVKLSSSLAVARRSARTFSSNLVKTWCHFADLWGQCCCIGA